MTAVFLIPLIPFESRKAVQSVREVILGETGEIGGFPTPFSMQKKGETRPRNVPDSCQPPKQTTAVFLVPFESRKAVKSVGKGLLGETGEIGGFRPGFQATRSEIRQSDVPGPCRPSKQMSAIFLVTFESRKAVQSVGKGILGETGE